MQNHRNFYVFHNCQFSNFFCLTDFNIIFAFEKINGCFQKTLLKKI